MSSYQLYVFLMCLVVFILLTSLSIFCIAVILRLSLRLINHGIDDKKIIDEHKKNQGKKRKTKYAKLFDYAFSGIICFVVLAMLVCSFVVKGNERAVVGNMPVYRIVNTGSMAKKNEKNTYLVKNGLDNQIQTFDLIKTERLPGEFELELYDIVVYEVDDMLIVHRIVEIEEPNSTHPSCRHFKLQGDAVESPDRFPVLYSQMRAIYRDSRIPFIGSFIMFMQSPAGWLCALLVLVALLAMPILDSKLEKARKKRLQIYLDKQKPSNMHKGATVIILKDAEGKIAEISLDVLESNFEKYKTVDIRSLKKKGLVDEDCRKLRILAKGELKKPLVIKAHYLEPLAIKKIKQAGGQIVKIAPFVDKKIIRPRSMKAGGGAND